MFNGCYLYFSTSQKEYSTSYLESIRESLPSLILNEDKSLSAVIILDKTNKVRVINISDFSEKYPEKELKDLIHENETEAGSRVFLEEDNVVLDWLASLGQNLITKNQQRLDQLAWLIEDGSMCTSISVIGGNFYISANEFSDKSRTGDTERALLVHIRLVMEYFRDIAAKDMREDEKERKRDELMRLICASQINVSSFGRMSVPEKTLKDTVSSQILFERKLPDTKLNEESRESVNRHLAMGFGLEIYRRVRKIENAIAKANGGDFSEISKEQLNAFKTFSHNEGDHTKSNILFKEPTNGVHAEMQILSQIIIMIEAKEKLPKEIYIAISKRCCLDCHVMLEAANEILREKEIPVAIKYEGSHDASFSDNWISPIIFNEGKKSGDPKLRSSKQLKTEEKRLSYYIGERYSEKKPDYLPSAGPYNQRHPSSGSEYSLDGQEKFSTYQSQLIGDLQAFQRRGQSGTRTEAMLSLGIQLCEIKAFSDLFTVKLTDDSTSSESKRRFYTIIAEMEYTNSGSPQELPESQKRFILEFLNDKNFSNQEISEFFASVKLPEVTKGSSPACTRPVSPSGDPPHSSASSSSSSKPRF